ncbi:MAG: type II secretion system secretin GspD [Lysobacterales bacterium]
MRKVLIHASHSIRPLLAILMLVCVGLSGCASMAQSPEPVPLIESPAMPAADSAASEPVGTMAPVDKFEAPAEDAADAAMGLPKVDLGSGSFLNEEAANRRDEGPIKDGEVVFNFEAESLPAVVKAILGDLLQQNYVIAPGLNGQVTFATAKPISADQAMSVLEMLLAWNNATLVYRDGRYTVLPVAQAIPGNLVPRIGPVNDARGYEVRAVPLSFISATAMQEVLTPYVRQGAIVKADNSRNLLVIAGTRADLENYLQTIETFDVDWLAGMSVGVYPLERVEATTVVPELEKVFGEGVPTPLAGMFRFMAIERINAVMVITPQPSYLKKAEEWLGRLDRGGSGSGSQLFVYYVQNVKALDLADRLTEVFGSGGGGSSRPASVGSVAPGESVEIRSQNSQAARREQRESERQQARPSQQPTSKEGISISGSEDIRITAIEESNALMIRATPGEYDAILGAIKRLDTVPLQVHIEAKILQVSLTGELSSGVRWFFNNATGLGTGTDTGTGTATNFRDIRPTRHVWDSFAGSATGSAGLAWTFLRDDAEAFITALQSRGNTKVLSAPSVVVLNNKTASLNSGTQIPVNTTSFQPITGGGGTGNNSFFNSTQFRDTGITLDVTPRVNPGGLVYMEIREEKSVPGATTDAVNGNVPVDKSTIETEVAVQSGETVVLAGLIEETKSATRSGVPGLVSIPILGRLFGSNVNRTSRNEILVLITPTVIDNSDAARKLSIEYQSRFKGLQPLLHPKSEAKDKDKMHLDQEAE